MLTSSATYEKPASLDEALRFLASNSDATVLAGGTDLMVEQELGVRPMSTVLDVFDVPEMRGIRKHGKRIWIGATTTWTDIAHDELLLEEAPSLAECARTVGALQIQNRGTLGGNLANASPAGDSLPVLLSLDAMVEAASAHRGPRFIPIDRFFLGYRKIELQPDELITGVWLPARAPEDVTHYRKVGTRLAQAISKVVLGARLKIDDGTVKEARIAYGSVAAVPLRCETAERALIGRPVDPRMAELVARDISPIDDIRSTATYRNKVAVNILRAWLESLV